jgi:hypothetical protein
MSERRHEERDPDLGAVEEDIAEHNPDPITRRESLEQELMEEARSEEGEEIELEDDLADHGATGSRPPDRRGERDR